MEAPAAIQIEGLRFRYEGNGFELRIPELRVEPGEKVVVVGPSGSGKTTLLNLVAGILVPDAGRILVQGEEITGRTDAYRRRFRISRIGLVFQEFELLDYLTVRENALLPFYVNRALTISSGVEAGLRELAARLGIADKLRRRPAALSHGERQRVAIARALVTEPSLILADEPTGNLDPENTRSMLELVFGEVERRGAAFVMVTHDHSLLRSFDRVVDFAGIAAGGGT